MVVRILIGFAVVTALILCALWLATGGAQEIVRVARNITNPFNFIFTGQLTSFRLPWQPETGVRGPIVNGSEDTAESEGRQTPEEELAQMRGEYDALVKEMRDGERFGEPSPYRGQIVLAEALAKESNATSEYVELHTSFDNTAPMKISGWSVQSALTGLRAYIPRGATLFALGIVNVEDDISLAPGTSAILSTATSPIGTSFRENACTGYLASLQTFTPPLDRSCPSPSEALTLTPENIRRYGDTCFDYVQSLSQCVFPTNLPSNISAACRLFITNNLSYNGCVQNHRHESGFAHDTWRIYLNAGSELWRNSHDIIRLLDAEGRTVDMVSY